jgi:hypothetical protein
MRLACCVSETATLPAIRVCKEKAKAKKVMAKKAQRDDPEQSKAFIEKAREIEADEAHSAADRLMERLAKTKPEPRKKQ